MGRYDSFAASRLFRHLLRSLHKSLDLCQRAPTLAQGFLRVRPYAFYYCKKQASSGKGVPSRLMKPFLIPPAGVQMRMRLFHAGAVLPELRPRTISASCLLR